MNELQFILAECLKGLALLFLALLAARALRGLRPGEETKPTGWAMWIRIGGYLLAALLAVWGARGLGIEISAGIHNFAADGELNRLEANRAYANARRAVELSPRELTYWETLERSKVALHQFGSALKDRPALTALAGGELDETDALLYAWCDYDVGDYNRAEGETESLIQKNRFFAAPYLLKGMTFLAQKNYESAEKTFLSLLQMFPNDQAGVEGLAHAYFLAGNPVRAEQVLDQTAQFSFSPAARKRFEGLKRLYAQ